MDTLSLVFSSSLSEIVEHNSSFDAAVLKVCYTGLNRNGSFISKETIERNLGSIYNCPIVCNYDRETDTLGGHDIDVTADVTGATHIVNLTQPIGVIPESARVWFETFEEEDGTSHEYLNADVLLWKRQEAYQKIKRDGGSSHSMEITVKSGHTDSSTGVYHIDDFEFTAFALIGVTPCFEGSSISLFSLQSFGQEFTAMMNEIKREYALSAEGEDSSHPYILTEGGMNMSTIKATTDKVVEQSESSVTDVESNNPDVATDETEDEKYALNSNVEGELRRALEAERIVTPYGECHRYWMIDYNVELGEVYAWDDCDDLMYGFNFTIDGDAVTVNFETKKRMKFEIVEFEGGDVSVDAVPVDRMKELVEALSRQIDELQKKYNESVDEMSALTKERDILKEYQVSTECKDKVSTLNTSFADLVGQAEFESVCEQVKDHSIDELMNMCYAIRGRSATVKFNYRSNSIKLPVEDSNIGNCDEDEPYGGLFVRYPIG